MHFLMNLVTRSAYSSVLLCDASWEHLPACVIKTVLKCRIQLVQPVMDLSEGGWCPFQLLLGGQEQDGEMIQFAKRRSGKGFVRLTEGGVAAVQHA